MSDFTSVHNSLTDDIIQAELGEDKSPFHCLETELEEKTQLDHLDGGHSDTPEILSPWQSRGHGNLNALGEAKSAESSPIISRRKNRASRARIRSSGNINHSGDGRSTDDLEHPTLPPRRRLRIYRAGNRTNKWVTREIAALEFLTGVRMRNEEAIRERALHGGNGDEDTFFGGSGLGYNSSWFSPEQYGDSETLLEGTPAATPNGMVQTPGQDKSMAAAVSITSPGVADDDSDSDGGWLDQPHPRGSGRTGVGNAATWRGQSSSTRSVVPGVAAIHSRISGGGSPAPARRLRGREAAHVRVPTMFRNHMHKLPGHGAAVVRQWEQGLTQQVRQSNLDCPRRLPWLFWILLKANSVRIACSYHDCASNSPSNHRRPPRHFVPLSDKAGISAHKCLCQCLVFYGFPRKEYLLLLLHARAPIIRS